MYPWYYICILLISNSISGLGEKVNVKEITFFIDIMRKHFQ